MEVNQMAGNNPDMALAVEFFVKAVENPRLSIEEGRPIFEDREFIRIRFPADNKRELVAPANEMHFVSNQRRQMTYAERFANVYHAFKNSEADFVSGTPLSELPVLTEAKRAELRAQNIKTVEQLAGLTDTGLRKIGMGARDLVVAAQAYLDRAKGTSEVAELKRQLEELKAQMQPAPKVETAFADQFEGLEDDDLKNMIRDAGGSVPRGNASRDTLLAALKAIAEKKEAA